MKLYLTTILISIATIIGINIAFNSLLFNLSIWYIVLATILSAVVVILIDGLFAFIIRKLPEKWFAYNKKCFNVSEKEQRFYKKLRIKNWKDKVIELGCFTNFSKSAVAKPNDNSYVERFILESNYGVVIHIVGILMGFLVIFFCPLKYWYMIGLPIALVNAVLNILPTFALRYNTPRLQLLHKRNERLNKK